MRTHHQVLPILAHVPKRVRNIQVIELGIGIPLPDCRSQIIRRHIQQRQIIGDECGIAVISACVFSVALHCEIGLQGGDINLFSVGSGIDEECLRVCGRRRQSIYAFLDGRIDAWGSVIGIIIHNDGS